MPTLHFFINLFLSSALASTNTLMVVAITAVQAATIGSLVSTQIPMLDTSTSTLRACIPRVATITAAVSRFVAALGPSWEQYGNG